MQAVRGLSAQLFELPVNAWLAMNTARYRPEAAVQAAGAKQPLLLMHPYGERPVDILVNLDGKRRFHERY